MIMQKSITFSFIFLGLLLGGYNVSLQSCIFASEDDIITRAMPVSAIENIGKNKRQASFTVTVSTPNPCWEFHEAQIDKSENEVWVKIIGSIDEDINCIQILGQFTTTINVNFSSPGEYLIHFWKSDTTSIDTTITVK
jgi:hypothetical protein